MRANLHFKRPDSSADRRLPNTEHLRRPAETEMLSNQQSLRNRNKIDHAPGLHSYAWEPRLGR